MDEDNPESVIHEMFTQNFWRGHPLGLPILGTPDTVPQFSRDKLLECFHSWYAPNNIVITAAGNLEHTRLVDMAVSALASGASRPCASAHGAPDPREPGATPQAGTRAGAHRAWRAVVPLAHERRYAASLLNIFSAAECLRGCFRISASGRGWRMRFSATCLRTPIRACFPCTRGRRAKPQGN